MRKNQNHVEIADGYIKLWGTIFLNLLKFIVVPIVLFSIMSGIISMSDIKKVGSIGIKTVVYYMCTTAMAIVIGLIGGNLFKGFFPILETSELSYEASLSPPFMDTVIGIFPSNFIAPLSEATMLQVIVMALLIGFAIILVGDEAAPAVKGINSFNTIFMKCMELILKLSPIGVFCLICPVVAANGSAILGSLAMVLLTAYICYFTHMLVIYSLAVRTMGDMNPLDFLRGQLPAMIFAFVSNLERKLPKKMLRECLIICPLVFIAGYIDAVAGGGGLVSLPAYMITGLPVKCPFFPVLYLRSSPRSDLKNPVIPRFYDTIALRYVINNIAI